MGYGFITSDKTLAKGVRRIALEQATRAIDHIRTPSLPQDEAVHEIRKSVKKLRALLRLVRPGLADHKPLDAQLRDAARRISALRDAAVLLDTVDLLAPQEGLPALRAALAATPHLDPQVASSALDTCLADLEAARTKLKGLKISGGGTRVLRTGLIRTHRQAQAALQDVLKDPTPEAVHAFRKRVKDHLYHSRLLTPLWPEVMTPHAAEADRLAETLGQMNDLAVLIDRIGQLALPPDEAAEARDLAAAARARLGHTALPLAQRMFAGTPEDLATRWAAWWRIWRDGA